MAMKMVQADEDLLKKHYKDLVEKPFFPSLLSYMTSGPVVPMVPPLLLPLSASRLQREECSFDVLLRGHRCGRVMVLWPLAARSSAPPSPRSLPRVRSHPPLLSFYHPMLSFYHPMEGCSKDANDSRMQRQRVCIRSVNVAGNISLTCRAFFCWGTGTVRGDYAIDVGRNVCHGSDAVDTATREIGLW